MITRTHQSGATRSTAIYSDCETYRYLLTRRWGDGPPLLFLLLNPSTATEQKNDPTIARCEARARAAGHGAFSVANLFALRSTDPAGLRRTSDPVGRENDRLVVQTAGDAAQVICGWGNHGAWLGRGAVITSLLRAGGIPLFHLGLTRPGHPRHPLYVASRVEPAFWQD